MRKLLLLALITTSLLNSLSAQKMERLDKEFKIICHATEISSGVRLMPPKELTSGRTNSANIEVNYGEGFTPEAKAAFQYAVDIWSSIINSPVTIRIDASWQPLSEGVLGSAGWATAFRGFDGALVNGVWYPVALAEKMAGRDLNDTNSPDIVASFSSTFNWYLGTDGNPGSGQYDLVSVVLHEIGHGLGFVDSFNYQDGFGFYGLGSGAAFPFIFDTYVSDPSKARLIDSFSNGSEGLGDALTSQAVIFDSPISEQKGIINVELYAPEIWDPGSSIAHLNESKYNGTPNSLMTPQIGPREIMHNPGPITLNMFADMGWKYTYINHSKHPNTEDITSDNYTITTTITSDTDYDEESITLHYSTDGFNTESTVTMTATENGGEFEAQIPSLKLSGQSYAYYISVIDEFDRTFSKPSLAPEFFFVFTSEADNENPVITHVEPNFIRDNDTEVEFNVTVKDFLPLEEVLLTYDINGGPSSYVTFSLIDDLDSLYSAVVDLSSANLEEGDQFNYTITVTDISSNSNSTTIPDIGQFSIQVVSLAPSVYRYKDDFNEDRNAFFESDHFRISDVDGFSSPAVHSDHPYLDGASGNGSDYTLDMRIPIILSDVDAIIRFDEIVLVEPGTSTDFTNSDFFDYVIVEGSNDGGKTWVPFIGGYDSRAQTNWLSAYNEDLDDDQNSLIEGSSSLFFSRDIDMLARSEFVPGEEILIRFRLHADELAHGWGWAIDNLEIQPDFRAPSIKHDYIDYVQSNTSIPIIAEVTDNYEVDSVAIEIFSNGQPNVVFQFDGNATNIYEANLIISELPLNESIEYRIKAYDNNEPEPNISYLPSEDSFFSVEYLNFGNSQSSYSNDFDSQTEDFVGNFFSIKSEDNFDNGAIHSIHPYPVGFGMNDSSNLSYTLINPIVISATKPLMAFDEVVIVEKNLEDDFGSASFKDYVIVEGSTDNGDTWTPFLNGYDSKLYVNWSNAINGNSDGNSSLYKYRIINMTSSGDFQAGDEVLIRFRLFSDDAINAWGWAIDNLEVQTDAITAIDQLAFEEISLYPNPTSGTLNISVKNNAAIGNAEMQIFNYKGQSIYSVSERGIENTYFNSIDVSKFPKGIYLFKLSNNSGSITKKVIIN
ncbi:T9SS type A sorting domain-containing protein [Fulvivirga ligni]|uniref:T9SS type A sorting domain-containing protein n=1 Tax=Fulvivirga ligni TaxID=2904246 RepID=UPI001F28701A|nr:T9SS type A sorting domain-containing protein [Fulvivirga ligni]UII22804.1 T9SS type A sorting domain-containing protein [Fulvivirga ligni]